VAQGRRGIGVGWVQTVGWICDECGRSPGSRGAATAAREGWVIFFFFETEGSVISERRV
jgi:hypothetical protein